MRRLWVVELHHHTIVLRAIPQVISRHLTIKSILGRLGQVPEVLLQVGVTIGVVVDLVEFLVARKQNIPLDRVAIDELGRESRIFLVYVDNGALIYERIVLSESKTL